MIWEFVKDIVDLVIDIISYLWAPALILLFLTLFLGIGIYYVYQSEQKEADFLIKASNNRFYAKKDEIKIDDNGVLTIIEDKNTVHHYTNYSITKLKN